MGVFEQRRRAYGYRTLNGFEECEEVGYERVGQLRTQEVAQYLFVGSVAERYLVKIVLLHKLVEDVRTQHHGLRYLNRHARERTEVGVHLYDIVKESQTSTLSSERSVADAGEVRVRVELHTVEHSHHHEESGGNPFVVAPRRRSLSAVRRNICHVYDSVSGGQVCHAGDAGVCHQECVCVGVLSRLEGVYDRHEQRHR